MSLLQDKILKRKLKKKEKQKLKIIEERKTAVEKGKTTETKNTTSILEK